jgi:hypothetical protein
VTEDGVESLGGDHGIATESASVLALRSAYQAAANRIVLRKRAESTKNERKVEAAFRVVSGRELFSSI